MSESNLEHGKGHTRALGVVVAAACVMGLVGAIWLHPETPLVQFAGATQFGPTATPAPAQTAFLHAPATASAIPSADQVFATRQATSDDDAPAAPTF